MSTSSGTVNYNGVTIRSASTTKFLRCADADCSHVHLIGFDERGDPFCELSLTEDMCLLALRVANGAEQ